MNAAIKPMTKAEYNALAWVHITGRAPKLIRGTTWSFLWDATERNPDRDGWRSKIVKPQYFAIANNHPMCRTLKLAQADGWELSEGDWRRRAWNNPSHGLPMARHGKEYLCISRDGHASLFRDENGGYQSETIYPAIKRDRRTRTGI